MQVNDNFWIEWDCDCQIIKEGKITNKKIGSTNHPLIEISILISIQRMYIAVKTISASRVAPYVGNLGGAK